MKTTGTILIAIYWLSISAAVIAGLIITKNINCLWFLLIGGLSEFKITESITKAKMDL